MKLEKKLLLVIGMIVSSFFFNVNNVLAADISLTCEYKTTPGFDDINLIYEVYNDDTVSLAFKKSEQLGDFYWQHTSGFKDDYLASAKKGTAYSCPSISYKVDMDYVTVIVGDLNDSGYVTAQLAKETVADKEEQVKVTSECNYNVSTTGPNKLKMDVSIKLQMNSSNERYIYINGHKAVVDDTAQGADELAGYLLLNDQTFSINGDQVSNLFKQSNFSMVEHNTFSCPANVYVVEDSFTDSRYHISTVKPDDTDYYTGTDPEVVEGGNDTTGDSNEDGIVGEPIDCADLIYKNKQTLETVDIVNDLFNIIMIVAPILLITFGSIDFAKATLASDEQAFKKAGKDFGKRAIAAILLFILPLLINIILGVAVDAGIFTELPKTCIVED